MSHDPTLGLLYVLIRLFDAAYFGPLYFGNFGGNFGYNPTNRYKKKKI